jgi:membrane-associated phospholipid phosphatase
VLVGYTNLKSRIFVLHPTLYDRELARLDAWLHFAGGDFQSWLLSTTWSSLRMGLLDLVYFYAWMPLALPFAVVFARAGGAAARRFLAALALVYVAGGFLYLAVPSVGPAFFERQRFAHLAEFRGHQVQEAMLDDLRRVTADPRSPATAFFGIAAFPSLHLASTALGVIAAWRFSRRLVWLLVPWNVAIAWSAVAWGWHYAVDFYPGLLLAWGAWRAAGALCGDLSAGAPPEGAADSPASG